MSSWSTRCGRITNIDNPNIVRAVRLAFPMIHQRKQYPPFLDNQGLRKGGFFGYRCGLRNLYSPKLWPIFRHGKKCAFRLSKTLVLLRRSWATSGISSESSHQRYRLGIARHQPKTRLIQNHPSCFGMPEGR